MKLGARVQRFVDNPQKEAPSYLRLRDAFRHALRRGSRYCTPMHVRVNHGAEAYACKASDVSSTPTSIPIMLSSSLLQKTTVMNYGACTEGRVQSLKPIRLRC